MSFTQFWFLRNIRKQNTISQKYCSTEEEKTLRYFIAMKYIEAITDGSDYQNSTGYYKLTQAGEAAFSVQRQLRRTNLLAALSIIISAATLFFSICGMI